MRKFLFIPIIIILLLFPTTVSAEPVPLVPKILPGQALAFNNVLTTNDALFIAAYELNWDTTVYTPEDAIVLLTDTSNNPYSCAGCIKHPLFLPGGIVIFYLTSSELSTQGITFGTTPTRILVQSNPTSFDDTKNSGSTGNITYISNATLADTAIDLEDRLPDLISSLQLLYPDDTLVSNGLITAQGAPLIIEVFSPIINLIPNAFSLAVTELFTEDFNPGTTTPLETQINVDNGSSPSFLGLSGLATGLGIDRSTLGFLILIGLGLPVLYLTRKEFDSLTLGFSALSGLVVWWAALGLIPIQIIFMLDIFMIGIIGIYFWRQVPTN